MKKCPYCAEKIQEEAIVCRYCGRDLPKTLSSNKQQSAQSKLSNPWRRGAKVAIVLTVLGAIGVIIRYQNNPVELIGNLTIGVLGMFVIYWIIVGLVIWIWDKAGESNWGRPILIIGLLIGAAFFVIISLNGNSFIGAPPIPTLKPSPTTTPDTLATAKSDWATRVASNGIDISNCIEWSKIDTSYLGWEVCFRGVVESIYRQKGPLFTSYDVHFRQGTDSVFVNTYSLGNISIGDCIIVKGTIDKIEDSGTLFINRSSIILCP